MLSYNVQPTTVYSSAPRNATLQPRNSYQNRTDGIVRLLLPVCAAQGQRPYTAASNWTPRLPKWVDWGQVGLDPSDA